MHPLFGILSLYNNSLEVHNKVFLTFSLSFLIIVKESKRKKGTNYVVI